MIRTAWLSFFLVGVGLEVLALVLERQVVISCLTLAFSYAVYRNCYQRSGTALLTAIIWGYGILLGAFFLTLAALVLGGDAGAIRPLLRDPLSFSVAILSVLYLAVYLFLTVQLRKINYE